MAAAGDLEAAATTPEPSADATTEIPPVWETMEAPGAVPLESAVPLEDIPFAPSEQAGETDPATGAATLPVPPAFEPEFEPGQSIGEAVDAPPKPDTPPPMPPGFGPDEMPAIVPATAPESPAVARSPGGGRVITVMAGKGGSGKTVVSTNLAIALCSSAGEDRVVIVDADLQFGDVALLLQLDPVRTIVDAARGIDDLSEPRLDALLLRHESGLRALPAPPVPSAAEEVAPKTVVRLVEMLRHMFAFVVVDTSPLFDDGLITLLEHSDDVLLVVDMDLPSVKNAKVALDALRVSGYPMERIRLLVNRVNAKARLDLVELERSLGIEVSASVPSDRLIPQSVNEGVPAVALSPRSKAAKSFHALARLFESGNH
jgi:MinD-like ATPase involved in chromosome partitioning or flagellar assembly